MTQMWVIWFFVWVMSKFPKIFIYIYIIVYIIRSLIIFNNTKIKLFIGSWNIFKLKISTKKGHIVKRLGTTAIVNDYLL